MKKQTAYLFWILLLTFGLMILILSAQILTGSNIRRLKRGNSEAAVTFTLNNRLQELVNLSFELEAKLSAPGNRTRDNFSLKDSIAMLEKDARSLPDFFTDGDIGTSMKELYILCQKQVTLFYDVSGQLAGDRVKKGLAAADTLRKSHLSDSVYTKARSVKIKLEEQLQETMNKNTDASERLSFYYRLLAVFAITAVLILATIIIQHTMRQVRLINKLEEATAAAEHSAAVKEQFLANMSHEIRTPLNAITGFSRLLQQSKLNPDQQQYAQVIEEASGNLIHIVNDILDISSIEAGKLRISKKFFNLRQLLQTTEHIFSEAASSKQLEYIQFINSDVPPYLKGDPDRLTQMLTNLISNAIKFTSTGYVKTIVHLAGMTGEAVKIRFIIEDTGPGIPPEKLDAIFQRFEQLESGKGSLTKGTGLGLSIVKNLAEIMGGNVSVKSNVGKGSIFLLEIPFEITQNHKSLNEAEDKEVFMGDKKFENARVLVADDNKINQLLIIQILKKARITPVIVSNGQEAIEAVGKMSFSLVLMDIQMPLMNGYTATKVIRANGFDKLPVVAMTAYTMPGEREKCMAAGMTDYIAKPIDFARLKQILHQYCLNMEETAGEGTDNTSSMNEFLLNLSGGDKKFAYAILEQIRKELPYIYTALAEIEAKNDYPKLKSLCHKLISTFSPLGVNTPVMRVVTQINNSYPKNEDLEITKVVSWLLEELGKFEILVEQMILQFRQKNRENILHYE